MFDLQLFSLNVSNKHDEPDLPGAMAFPPPKRTARGRSLDILNVFIDFSGEDENSKDWKTSVIKSFASTFLRQVDP